MDNEIAKVYSPAEIELRWSRTWVEKKLYRPPDTPSGPRFALSLPPPNITGSLHMGHMLEHTEIDTLMRWRRMRGEDVLWLPGMDHASIATQMIVEVELGREALPHLEGPDAKSSWRREGQRRRREMGLAGREFALRRFDANVMIEALEKVYASKDQRSTLNVQY